jgi:hypothetical protein
MQNYIHAGAGFTFGLGYTFKPLAFHKKSLPQKIHPQQKITHQPLTFAA